ncbi:hypothetical protein [Escherichia phage FL12]
MNLALQLSPCHRLYVDGDKSFLSQYGQFN